MTKRATPAISGAETRSPPADDLDELASALETDGLDAWAWGSAATVVVAGLIAAVAVRWLLTRALSRRIDRTVARLIARLSSYVVVAIALVYALDSLGVRVGPLLGALGILGIALAFALKDILENFVAGILLQIRRPFTYGDEVEVDDHEGRVVDVDARIVTIVTPDGETVMLPSATVIKSDVTNLTDRGSRRTDLPVGVAYGTDLDVACTVLEKATVELATVHDTPPPEALLVGFGESSIDIVVRYWHGATIAEFWRARSDVTRAVDRALADAGITIPFPQRTLWLADRHD